MCVSRVKFNETEIKKQKRRDLMLVQAGTSSAHKFFYIWIFDFPPSALFHNYDKVETKTTIGAWYAREENTPCCASRLNIPVRFKCFSDPNDHELSWQCGERPCIFTHQLGVGRGPGWLYNLLKPPATRLPLRLTSEQISFTQNESIQQAQYTAPLQKMQNMGGRVKVKARAALLV